MGQQKQESAQTVAGSRSADKRKRKITVGSVWSSRLYGNFEVIEYNWYKNVIIEFLDTGFKTKTEGGKIRAGNIKDKLSRSVCGVGFVGVGDFLAFVKRRPTKAYSKWHAMINRCYSDKYQKLKPTYKGCTVCDEWHNFQNFAKWFYENYPDDGEEYHLDKDLKLIGNKVYSPETCMFVSQRVNMFTVSAGASRGKYMIGVCLDSWSGKIRSDCSNPFTESSERLGYFETELEAHLAWRKRKSELAYELAMVQDRDEVKQALLSWRSALDGFEIHKIDTGNYYEAL